MQFGKSASHGNAALRRRWRTIENTKTGQDYFFYLDEEAGKNVTQGEKKARYFLFRLSAVNWLSLELKNKSIKRWIKIIQKTQKWDLKLGKRVKQMWEDGTLRTLKQTDARNHLSNISMPVTTDTTRSSKMLTNHVAASCRKPSSLERPPWPGGRADCLKTKFWSFTIDDTMRIVV